MATGLIISGVVILLGYLTILAYRYSRANRQASEAVMNDTTENADANKSDALPVAVEDIWWEQLNNFDQLHLALALADKAMPVWEKYISAEDITYRDAMAQPFIKVNSALLKNSIGEIYAAARHSIPPEDHKGIYICYKDFIGPVLAMQDGNWFPPYPVKKIFLAVYYLLKFITDQNNPSTPKNMLSIAINQLLDCIDVSKICTREELLDFLKVYKKS